MSNKAVVVTLCVVLTLAGVAMAVGLGKNAPAEPRVTPLQQGTSLISQAFWTEPSLMVLLGIGGVAIAPRQIKKYRRRKHA